MTAEMYPGTSHQDDETIDENLTQRLVRGENTTANIGTGGRLSPGSFDLFWTNHVH